MCGGVVQDAQIGRPYGWVGVGTPNLGVFLILPFRTLCPLPDVQTGDIAYKHTGTMPAAFAADSDLPAADLTGLRRGQVASGNGAKRRGCKPAWNHCTKV